MQRYHAPRRAFLAAISVGAALAIWLRPFRIGVSGESMRPALEPGDMLVATARGRLRPGALVVVARPDRPGLELVKRIAARPGQIAGGRVLERGEYWVVGRDPSQSTDSRSFGPIRREAISGVVRFRYWPVGRRASVTA